MEEYNPKHSEPSENTVKNKKLVWYIAIGLCAALLLAAIVVFCVRFFGGRENFDGYKKDVTSQASAALPENPIDFKTLQSENADVCAWIKVDGTVIDYPILQSAIDADDNFYLDHDMSGEKKRAGSIYIQKLNSKEFDNPNTLIYGHNMLNGTMFGQLKKFRNKNFFDENRNIYIYTPNHILKYEIISAFVYDDRHILNSFNFDIENECKEFFDECINPKSAVKQVLDGAALDTNDNIITLSTCTSNDSERYLVIGKLVDDTITAN